MYNKILKKKIMEIKDIIQTKFNEYNEYMTKINEHLTLLENRINLLENQLKNKVEKNENQITNDDNIVELKKELLDIDNETINEVDSPSEFNYICICRCFNSNMNTHIKIIENYLKTLSLL